MTGNIVSEDAEPLVFLGDSFVEAIYAPEDVRFVSQVERHLASEGLNFRCLNGGYSGATTLQLFNVFLNKVVPHVGRGGRVVFFLPQSDLPIYFRPSSYWYPTDRYAPLSPPVEPAAADLPRGSKALTSILGLAVWAAQEFEIDFILVSSPNRNASREDDPFVAKRVTADQHDALMKRRDDIRRAVLDFVASSGVAFLDAEAAFSDTPSAFYDDTHLNERGHGMFAAWLADQLRVLNSK
ncbi:SGNH/GDSL hydrolase family protein [Paenarthrobacter nicotinovorans]|uniref:SGNH/GDSL hydrolase family protein n=1 Tax=Paenarthrobacter nicotinovorans TaxID=29320 RepID=A0ABV0GU27_PAENI